MVRIHTFIRSYSGLHFIVADAIISFHNAHLSMSGRRTLWDTEEIRCLTVYNSTKIIEKIMCSSCVYVVRWTQRNTRVQKNQDQHCPSRNVWENLLKGLRAQHHLWWFHYVLSGKLFKCSFEGVSTLQVIFQATEQNVKKKTVNVVIIHP